MDPTEKILLITVVAAALVLVFLVFVAGLISTRSTSISDLAPKPSQQPDKQLNRYARFGDHYRHELLKVIAEQSQGNKRRYKTIVVINENEYNYFELQQFLRRICRCKEVVIENTDYIAATKENPKATVEVTFSFSSMEI